MEDCLFCKIVKGEIPSKKIYEDDELLAFLDIFPFEKGHTLIIPKEHYENILDIPKEKFLKVCSLAHSLAKDFDKKLGGCGFNLLQNTKSIAGQEIRHFHLHLIPRRENKGLFRLENKSNYINEEELDEYYKKLKID